MTSSVRELHRSGQLALRYPQVRSLLAGLSGPDLLTAGQLLARLDPDEVLAAHPAAAQVRVAITGHGTLAPLVPPLTAELARHGILLRPFVGDFDGWVFELGDPGSALYAARPDLVLCLLDPMLVLDELPLPWQAADAVRVLDSKLGLIEQLVTRFAAASSATLVLNTIPLPRAVTAQLVSLRARATLGAAWREANARLLRLAEKHDAVVAVDLDPLLAQGIPASDPRLRVYARAHLSPDLLAGYAREIGHLAAAQAGRGRKCLVLDLDSTLWGGVLGDDGIEGIEVGETRRGEAFTVFQKVVKQLGSQGVLLAVVSKNDLDPVRAVLREHKGMTLGEEDFVRITANWRPKHENLAELAADLNLGLDSFVFADDSDYECGLVGSALPDVAVVPLRGDPAAHADTLLRDGWFDVREVTSEDTKRGEKYRDELLRQDFLNSFDSLESYLRELEVTVRLGRAADAELPRVSQLTLRTNQFNLSVQRLTLPQVHALAGDPAALVVAVHAADRFGENGLIGAVLAHREHDTVHIDNFLLSCRVFSRGIEQACLSSVLCHARDTGAAAVTASYRPSARNAGVRDFYSRYGFAVTGDDETGITYRHDLKDITRVPDHVRLTDELGRTAL